MPKNVYRVTREVWQTYETFVFAESEDEALKASEWSSDALIWEPVGEPHEEARDAELYELRD